MNSSSLSRRDFLKIAGVAGASVAIGAGFGMGLSACGEPKEETITTVATTGSTPSSTAGASTTVSAGPEVGREVRIGYSVPITGSAAAFGVPAKWLVEEWKGIWGDGVVLGDGKKHPIRVILKDMQSDSNRAAQVAQDLVSNEKVDILSATGTPVNVNPVSDMGEALGCPTITADTPDVSWYFGRGAPEEGWKWTYHFWFRLDEILVSWLQAFDMIPSNKVVGGFWTNDADGIALGDPKTGEPPFFEAAGYRIVDPGRPNPGTEDYTAIISLFLKEGVDFLLSSADPPDFANFWKQAVQQGFRPKLCHAGKSCMFPAGVNALGDLGDGITGVSQWNIGYPWVASTGIKGPELAAKYEADTGEQWSQPLGWYALFEVWTDVLKRTADLDDPETIREAVRTTKTNTLLGLIEFAGWFPNFGTTPSCCDQWWKGEGKWPYDSHVVANGAYPEIPISRQIKPITFPS